MTGICCPVLPSKISTAMDFSGSAWTEGLGETKLLIGWTSVERLKLDNRGRSSFGMIAALKATGCAKVVNTQTESQMGKSHKHTHTLNVSNRFGALLTFSTGSHEFLRKIVDRLLQQLKCSFVSAEGFRGTN